MDQNDFDDETPAVRFIKRLIVRKKRVAKETMKSKKEVMFKKANDVLKKCKSWPSKEDAEDAFGTVNTPVKIFSQRQQYFLHFKIQELIYLCQEQQSSRENYDRPHFSSPTNFAPPSPHFNP